MPGPPDHPHQSSKRLLSLPALLPSPVPGTNALANAREEPGVIASYGHDHFIGGLLPWQRVVLELCARRKEQGDVEICYTAERVVPASIHRSSVLVSPFLGIE